MKYIFALFLTITLACRAADWTLPAANQGWWTPGTAEGTPGVGVPGGIAQYLAGGASDRATTGTVINVVTAHGADSTGAADCQAAVAAALTAASGPTVIYFPAGTYRLDTGWLYSNYKDDITIRGAGVGVTNFIASSSGTQMFTFSSPGSSDTNEQTITGTKTKGTATLAIANTTGYTEGRHAVVRYENETDNARIQAGAAPFWHSIGSPFGRAYTVKIISVVDSTSVTVDPPLPGDGTNLVTKIGLYPADNKTSRWGFEDFTVTFDAAQHPVAFINFDSSEYCWVHNVQFLNWSKTSSSGSCVTDFNSYRSEIRKCYFEIATGASSDGGIGSGASSSSLYIDNIFTGTWDNARYDNGNACNSVFAYNYVQAGQGSVFHNFHPSLNLIEGNVMPGHQSDGYHGSSSHNTIFRNWTPGSFGAIINRFKRNYVIAGNVMGTSGTTTGIISWGNPNIGNGAADGFAGPTGLSNQVGQLDYAQPGYGVGSGSFNTYVIQSGDVSAGDFWRDWKISATLTTRTSATEGVFAVSNGQFYTGTSATSGGSLLVYARASDGTIYNFNGTVTNVAGANVTISFGGGTLPAAASTVYLFMGPSGWQERDLDVQSSSTVTENYMALAAGGGSVANGTADVLPSSLVYSAQPAWWTDGGFAGTWPPVSPDAPSFSASIIPAGYRFTNDPPPDPAPTLSNATIGTSGTTITFSFTESITVGAGGSAGWALTLSTGSATATYASGSGTGSLVYNLSSTVNTGVTGTAAYTQPTNGLEDGTGNDLATLSGFTITNNSTQGDYPPEIVSAVIPTDGNSITFTFDQAVSIGAGGSAGWAINLSSGSVTATYSSGSGTSALAYTLSSTIASGVTGDVAYTQPGNGIEDSDGDDLANLSGVNFTNNSTVGQSATQAGWSVRKAIKLLSR